MKQINFRIIELPTHQVLLAKDFDNEDKEAPSLIVCMFFVNGVKSTQSYGYKTDESRDEMFEKITDAQAQKILDASIKMFR